MLNCNHSSPAQDMLLLLAKKKKADIVCVTEPHSNLSAPGWHKTMQKTVGILVRNNLEYFVLETPSHNFSVIKIANMVIICAYLSPNREIDAELQSLQPLLSLTSHVLLGGDFNCRVRGLSNLQWRPRDHTFEEFMDVNDLKVENSPAPTCFHQGRLTVHDLILTKNVKVHGVKILSEEETLSDHFPVLARIDLMIRKKSSTVKRIDEELLQQILETTIPTIKKATSVEDVKNNARSITEYLSDIVEYCIHEVTRNTNLKWWNSVLSAIHHELKKIRRLYFRTGNQNVHIRNKIKNLRKKLRLEIKKAKRSASREFIPTDQPWGKPYRILIKTRDTRVQTLSNEDLLLEKFGIDTPMLNPLKS